ncbi:MAG: YCF48-related protein [Chloroflexota bacterium]
MSLNAADLPQAAWRRRTMPDGASGNRPKAAMRGEWELLATRAGGTVTSLVTTTDGNMLAATPAGVRRSSDGGRSWAVLGPANLSGIELVTASPAFTSDATLLAGTADGLLRSLDGGRAWQQALVGGRVMAILFSPTFAHDGLLLAGTEQDGILRSDDGGSTWKSANPGLLDLTVLSLACSPAFVADHAFFAATSAGLFRSTNAGRTWRAIDTLPTEPAVQCVSVSPRFASDATVLAGTETDGLLRSTDGGATWEGVDALVGRSVTALAWSASGNCVAAATDTGVMLSHTTGASWRRVGAELGPVLSLAFTSDGTLLAGMPRVGIARSSDLVRWESANTGLQASLVVALALSPEFGGDQTLYVAGLEDGVAVSADGGTRWDTFNGGLPEETAVFGLAAGPRGLFAATHAGVFRRDQDWHQMHPAPSRAVRADAERVVGVQLSGAVMTSLDSGASWSAMDWPTSVGQPQSVVMACSTTLVVGSSQASTSEVTVWRSEDGQDFQRMLVERGSGVVALAAGPTSGADSAMFAGVGDTVFRSVGGVFERVPGEPRPVWRRASLPATVCALETSPDYARDRTLLAATTAGVCISRDAGQTFQSLGTGIDDRPVVAAAFSPAYAEDQLIYSVELGGNIWRHRPT